MLLCLLYYNLYIRPHFLLAYSLILACPLCFFFNLYILLSLDNTPESKVTTNVFHIMVIKKHGNVRVTFSNIRTYHTQKQSAIKSVIFKKNLDQEHQLSGNFRVIFVWFSKLLVKAKTQLLSYTVTMMQEWSISVFRSIFGTP